VVKLIKDDGKIRLVLKELPILSDESVAAAKLALASNKQGKYFEMYQKLFSEPGNADKEKALRVAKELGLDVDQLQKDAEDPEIQKSLDQAKDLAQKSPNDPSAHVGYALSLLHAHKVPDAKKETTS